MDISTRTVSTRVHTAVAKTADFKDVAILAVKRQLGLSDAAVVSADASVADDGTITVEVVESVDDTPVDSATAKPEISASDAALLPVADAAKVGAPII